MDATSSQDPPLSSAFPINQAPSLTLTPDELRHLILEYLTHSTYLDSAVAFAKEWPLHDDATNGSGYASTSASVIPSDAASGKAVHAQTSSSTRNDALAGGEYEEEEEDELEDEGDSEMMDAHSHAPFELDVEDDDDSDIEIDELRSPQPYRSRRERSHYKDTDTFDSLLLTRREIKHIRVRRDIKFLICEGKIQTAIDLCNHHFPGVLESSPTGKSSSSTPRASSGFNGSNNKNRLSAKASSASLSNLALMNRADSPLLLSLSLQIQLFIEVVRSSAGNGSNNLSIGGGGASGISRPSTPYSHHSPSSGGHLHSPGNAMEASIASLASHTTNSSNASGMSRSTNNSTTSTSALSLALNHAQVLHAQASSLPDPGLRGIYLKELETVSGLLPYHDPRLSPVAHYLDTERRKDLAEAVSGAILLSLGHKSTRSTLENCIRQNELVYRTLYDLKAQFPAEKGAAKNKPQRPVTPFSMPEFMDTTFPADS